MIDLCFRKAFLGDEDLLRAVHHPHVKWLVGWGEENLVPPMGFWAVP